MKPSPFRALNLTAIKIAITAPEEHSEISKTFAVVPWWTVDQLRAALEARGFDWRTPCRQYHATMNDRSTDEDKKFNFGESDDNAIG